MDMKKINQGIFLFLLSILLSSCSYRDIRASLSQNFCASRVHDTMMSGKKQFRKHAYSKARQYFKQVLQEIPYSYEAEEAQFYIYMMNFSQNFSEKNAYKINFLDGGYPDFRGMISGLSEEINRKRKVAYAADNKLKVEKKYLEKQKRIIADLKKRLAGVIASEKSKEARLASLREKIAKSKAAHEISHKKLTTLRMKKEKAERKLKELQESYQVMQEIELRKERREKELRELGP